ncbi:MAG: hypothetical protein ACP5N1_01060 [Candidatus Woesearchaeota archaeon]
MDLFKPSQKLLDAICKEGEIPLIHYGVFPYGPVDYMYEFQMLYGPGLFEEINSFYCHELNGDKKRLDIQGIHNVSGELFKNWIDHAPEGHNLVTGTYLGRKGVCYGFYDGGEFFKNPKLKQQIENKSFFKEFHFPSSENTCQSGFNNHIFPCSDLLEVDVDKGIIYAVQLAENIIAPEGMHGSQYCYDKRKKGKAKSPDY